MMRRIVNKISALLGRATGRKSDSYLTDIYGIIHVGANIGQERDLYAKHGLKVLWIEPIPELFAKLVANIKGYENQSALQALVTDRDDREYQFYISSNEGASSSIFELKLHKDIWPSVQYVNSMTIKGTTLSSLLRLHRINVKDYDALVMDTQGSELLVLKGCGELIQNFKVIQMEVADFEAYKDCCQLPDIDRYLRLYGYEEYARNKFASHPRQGSYFDIVYRKRNCRLGSVDRGHETATSTCYDHSKRTESFIDCVKNNTQCASPTEFATGEFLTLDA